MATESESQCSEFSPTKHKIFLSHSGEQKDFVEQLCVDLERVQHTPFFDKYSLPRGEKFAPKILDAARQCKLAVVVLSEKYVVSKWPMVELCEFMKQAEPKNASIKILPLFYKLSVEECKKPSAEWYKKWVEFAAKDSHGFNANECKEALRKLASWNGVKLQGSEVDYRKEIVGNICQLVRPDYWDEEGIQGRDRLCKIVADEFREGAGPLYTSPGVMAVGLYGLGGIGKTTICRAMCHYLYGEFSGKVWHMQLPTDPSEADVLKQLHLVLENLTEADAELLKRVSTINEAGVHLKKRMKGRVVFLAIDNLWNVKCSMDAARSVLKSGFGEGSKILVTARSGDVLDRLLGPESRRRATPTIVEKDAVGILLNLAAPRSTSLDLSEDERFVIDAVVKRYHGHPLALNIFGDVLGRHGRGGTVWRAQLEKLEQNRMKDEDEVSSMIQTGYDDLSTELKLVFLDVAVFLPISLRVRRISIKDASDWLNRVHVSSGSNDLAFDGEERLQTLRKSTLLDWENDGILQIHDLVRDHAVKEVRKSAESRCLCLGLEGSDDDERVLAELSTEAWGKLERIALMGKDCWPPLKPGRINFVGCRSESLAKMRWDCCSAVKALYVRDCATDREFMRLQVRLDLSALCGLRELDLDGQDHLMSLTGLAMLTRLRSLRVAICKSLKSFPDLSPLTQLQELSVIFCPEVEHLLGVENLANLQKLNLTCMCLWEFPELGSLPELRSLWVQGCEIREMSGARPLGAGRPLEFPMASVRRLVNLTTLEVSNCIVTMEFLDLSEVPRVERLSFSAGSNLKRVQGFSSTLGSLDLSLCEVLEAIPDLRNLPKLRRLNLRGCKKLPLAVLDVQKLWTLDDVDVADCAASVDAWIDCIIHPSVEGDLFESALEGLLNKINEARGAEEKLAVRDAMAAAADTIIQKIAAQDVYRHTAEALLCLSWRQGQPDVEMADRIAKCIGVKALASRSEYQWAPVGVLAAVAATGKYWDAFLQHSIPTLLLDSWDKKYKDNKERHGRWNHWIWNRRQMSLYVSAVDCMAQNGKIAELLKQHGPRSATALLIDHIELFNGGFWSFEVGLTFVGEHRLGKEFAIQVLENLRAL